MPGALELVGFFFILAALALLAAIPAIVAQHKGRSFWAYWVPSLLFPVVWLVMLVVAIVVSDRRGVTGT
jgi:hypothetical protein